MFPVSDDSDTIVSCLLNAAKECGVHVRRRSRVKEIRHSQAEHGIPRFIVTDSAGLSATYDRVLLTTGSNKRGYQFAASLGHTIVPCVPSLFTYKVSDSRLQGLAGVSFPTVTLTLKTSSGKKPMKQAGPLLITHWGLSGPAVLKLSAWGARVLYDNHYRATLTVNFMPHLSVDDLSETMRMRKATYPKRHVSADNLFASHSIPTNYWKRVVEYCGIDKQTTWSTVTTAMMTALVTELHRAEFEVSGKGVFKDEFVTCGGVKLSEVDFKTMQSRITAGLYFAGEILDIDGITGGFNFQNAWTTDWLAGNALQANTL